MLNKKDMLILAYLRKNSRISLTSMSRQTQLPVSTIFDRINLHKGDVIKKYITLLNFSKLGFHTKANIMLKANKKDKTAIREHLLNNLNVNSLYKINNGFDYMVECIFRNINDLEEFMDVLDEKFSIKTKEVHYIIDELKREEFMSRPELLDMVSA